MSAQDRFDSSLQLKHVRGYHVGGNPIDLAGLPVRHFAAVANFPARLSDPNGRLMVGQLYAQHFAQTVPRSVLPLQLWHGGGLTGVCWDLTPDGRPGWQDFFLRSGFDLYVTDGVDRGRASSAQDAALPPSETEHRTLQQAWNTFRFGPPEGYEAVHGQHRGYDGQLFPVQYVDHFARQFVARRTGLQNLSVEAYIALLIQSRKSIIVAHSEGARLAMEVAARRPDLVAALVLVEPAGSPVGEVDKEVPLPAGLSTVPHCVVWGDFFEYDKSWQAYRNNVDNYMVWLASHGCTVRQLDLPEMGIRGNSHFPFMDHNSDEVARLILDWLRQSGLA